MGKQQSLDALVDKALADETIRLLLRSLAPWTQGGYLRGWKFRIRYCEERNRSPWLDTTTHEWDLEIPNYLPRGYTVIKIAGSGLSSRFCAIKFLHLVEGRGDFEGKTHRIHALINAVKRKGETKQQLPASPEILRWGEARMANYEGERWKATELRAAIIAGFHFALRISEIEGFDDRDVSFQEIDGEHCVTIVIRGSKTDQQRVDARRTLAATHCDSCPVLTMATWLGAQEWRPNGGEFIFSRRIANRISHTLNELAMAKGLDASRFSPHSLRKGCATTLYAAGIGPIDIERWCRWKSSSYMRYMARQFKLA